MSNDDIRKNVPARVIQFSPPDISELEINEVAEALRSGWITTGPRTKELERRLAEYCHTSKTVCLNSATAAEELNFRICGIEPGDEVIVPAYTYTASASAPIHCGAKIIFVDSQKDNCEMDYDKVADAITEIFALFKRCNKYIDETMPWALAKEEDKKDRLATVLYNLIEGINIGASLLEPFMPETSKKILQQINAEARAFDDMEEFGKYKSGNKVTEKPEILFARMDIKDVMEKVEEIKAAQKKDTEGEKYPEVEAKPEITIDDFDKVQIQVGEVIKCEPVPKAKKLLVSQIKIGAETRQIVSGIAKYYKPEEMVGKKVAVITNLKPCKLCGVESQGMILAAGDDEGNLSVVTVDKDIVSGSQIC